MKYIAEIGKWKKNEKRKYKETVENTEEGILCLYEWIVHIFLL